MDRKWHYGDDEILVDKFVTAPLENNVFLLACAATGDSAIIDAASDPDGIVTMAEGTRVTAVFTTHGHWDHVGATEDVARRLGVPHYIGQADMKMAKLATAEPFVAGEFPLGELTLEIIHTPGHTQGSHCIKAGHLIFTGDTLFPGGPGATQTPDDFAQIMESLDTKLFTQPDETIILPGHGLDTTIGEERPEVETWRARGW
jgi:glyoxylase-like metal-dependent hydrolase (beta-lactamase superfamily II)